MSSIIKSLRKNSSLLFTWILFPLSIFSQINNIETEKLVNNLHTLSKQKVSDLVYIQTSKGVYETEEDVWFKCYVLNIQSFIPSIQSKTLFVQLINDKTQQAVWEEKYEIENGFVNGHLYLQDTLQAGSYTMAAYSSHSFYKNTSELYAVRKLKILNRISEKREVAKVEQDSIIDFRMFPEGGNLVSGISNTLAFKAVDTKGKPVIISGTLFENKKPLLEFKSLNAGMGSFVFTPDIDKSYHIKISDDVKNPNYKLPEIFPRGISMQLIENSRDFLLFNISQSKVLEKTTVYLRLQIRGEVYGLAKANINDHIKIKVQLKDVPQGIAEVTLFNANFEPVCERLVYVKQDEQLHIKTILDKNEYQTREKVTLKIQVTDEQEQPVVAHLGLSVYDKIYKNPQDSKNILTHYNLTTQLKGKLHNPAYYFDTNNENRKEALNLLLLTQGWRRYVWNEINLNEQSIPKQVIFDDIKGKVIFPRKYLKNPQQSFPVLMAYAPIKEEFKEFVFVDSTKMFTIEPKHLKMGRQVYLKLMVPEKPKYTFNINDHAFKTINTIRKTKKINYPLPKINIIKTDEVKPFKYPSDNKVLDEVIVTAKKRKVHRDKYLGKLDSITKLDLTTDYIGTCTTLNCYVHGREGSTKPIDGKTYGVLIGKNGEELGEHYTGAHYRTGSRIYKYPKYSDAYILERFNLIRTKGYYGKREFYQPVYDKETIEETFPDYRNTLYWNPSVITNKKGEVTIEFFCSDINTKFIGIIEGTGGQGLLGSASFDFVVKEPED